jgi:TPR repeat protein
MTNLGYLYANGQGVTQDYQKARELYQKAADAGNAWAKNELLGVRPRNGMYSVNGIHSGGLNRRAVCSEPRFREQRFQANLQSLAT